MEKQMLILTDEKKLAIIKEIYAACYGHVSFSDIGTDLSHLTQAILAGLKCELSPCSKLVLILREKISITNQIWKHIHIESTVLCINCETEIYCDEASYCFTLSGWLGHNCCVDANNINDYYSSIAVV